MFRGIDKTKLKIIIIGFFVLFIPLFFLCKKLNSLYSSTKEEFKLDLKEKILSVSVKFKNDLDTYNYLNSEITKIHAILFPDLKDEITDKILDDSFAQNLYTQETFDSLVPLAKKEFDPIFISFGTNNLEKFISYYSPELERDIKNETAKELGKESTQKLTEEKRKFLYSKASYDAEYLIDLYKICFKTDIYEKVSRKLQKDENILYKYLSRFKLYQYYTKTFYSDYYDKQLIYNVSKYTISKKGIHGYYSLIIPQTHINPVAIIKAAIKNNSNNEIDIGLVSIDIIDLKKNLMNETEDGYEYFIDLTTELKNHLNIYKKLKEENKKHLLSRLFKLKIKFPKELEQLNNIKFFAHFFTITLVLIYFFLAIKMYGNKYKITINLTRKLILVLSAIIILPIIGVGLLSNISTQKFTKIIDNNVSQNLSNEIDNLITIHNESNQRQLSEIFELKRKIEKNHFFPEMKGIYDGVISKEDKDTWYKTWTTNLVALSQDGSFYNFYPYGKHNSKSKIENTYGVYLPKYANNLGIVNKSQTNLKNEMASTFTLGTLEQYITLSLEEQSAGQESIPHRLLLAFNETYSAVYFYAQDSKKQHNLMINALTWNDLRNRYISNLRLPKRQNWFETKNDYSDINLGIAISDHFYIERNITYPFLRDSYKKVNDIITKSIISKDSISENAQQPDGKIVKKSVYTDNDAFVIGGVAKSNYNTMFSFGINLVFPILLTYSLFLMFLLTGFISVFIKEPVEIYKEAINSLENKEYGIKIDSFSKDEFDSITTAFNEMSLAIKQKFMISRYVSDKLIQSVRQDNIQEAGDGKQEKVTILSSDIRNFTGTSELYEPSVIVEMLNSYFTIMQQAISDNGGIIDKYIGDAIQAVFYDDPDKENQVIRASKAALAMRKALEEFNKEREESGLFTIQNGIGIDTDFAITGTIGTEKGRKDFSVNGDVVARAAELEAKTKQTESKILISKRSLEELDCHGTSCLAMTDSKPNMVGINKTNHTPHQSPQLILRDFDSEAIELIDVR